MGFIKGDELALVGKLLSIPSSASSGVSDIDLDSVAQTFPVVPEIIRRGKQVGNLGGWFTGLLENVHVGAGFQSNAIDPYAAGAFALPPFPPAVPITSDVWLLKAYAIQSAGVAGLDEAILGLNPLPVHQGFGRDSAGALVVGTPQFPIARWDAVSSAVTGGQEYLITEAGQPSVDINIRIPREGCLITFHTESAGAAEYQAILLMGIFPAGMGQDIAT